MSSPITVAHLNYCTLSQSIEMKYLQARNLVNAAVTQYNLIGEDCYDLMRRERAIGVVGLKFSLCVIFSRD